MGKVVELMFEMHGFIAEVSPETKHLLNEDTHKLIEDLIDLIKLKANSFSIPIRSFALKPREYPQERYEELVLEVFVQASTEEGLAFWDNLESVYETWEKTLPSKLKERLTKLLSISVIWE